MHVPVLPDEVLALLEPQRGGTFVDCTVGLGGHSRLMLERGAARLIGIDRDTDALALAPRQLVGIAVGKPGIAILDVRDVDEWIGESSSPYGKDFCPRKGRIPGAVWLEWYRMMKPSPAGPMFTKREAEEFRQKLIRMGVITES